MSIMGPVSQNRISRSWLADEDIPAGVAVVAGATGQSCKLPTGANQQSLGISLQATLAGEHVPVLQFGETKAIADAAITRNSLVMVNAVTGQLAPVGTTAGTNYFAVGMAMEAAAAQGSEFVLFVQLQRVQG